MDEIASKEEMEFLQNFLYDFLDICEVVGNLSSDMKNETEAFVDKLEEFYNIKNGKTKKVNINLLKDLIQGEVSMEIKHRKSEKITNPDTSLIPEGMYCYDNQHVCPFRKRLYYANPLDSLIECKYLGEILKNDPCFGDEVKICDIKNDIK